MVNKLVDYGCNIFRTSSRKNIISNINLNSCASKDIKDLKAMFLPERIKKYWNNLPAYCKNSQDVNEFKANLDRFKKESIHSDENNFWEVSRIILEKIEGNPCYSSSKASHNKYLLENPYIAKRKGINIHTT